MPASPTLRKALHNTQLALTQLEAFLTREPQTDDVVQAAIIQAFEFTFEATWKLIQKMGEDEGLVIHSPRSALAYGFRRSLWATETPWLAMLRDRNLTVHTYNRDLAARIAQTIRTEYAMALRAAVDTARRIIEATP